MKKRTIVIIGGLTALACVLAAVLLAMVLVSSPATVRVSAAQESPQSLASEAIVATQTRLCSGGVSFSIDWASFDPADVYEVTYVWKTSDGFMLHTTEKVIGTSFHVSNEVLERVMQASVVRTDPGREVLIARIPIESSGCLVD
jgi:hypothetical protein